MFDIRRKRSVNGYIATATAELNTNQQFMFLSERYVDMSREWNSLEETFIVIFLGSFWVGVTTEKQ